MSLSVEISSYGTRTFSAKFSKSIVGGLTDFTNMLVNSDLNDYNYIYKKESISSFELIERLREDFRKGYLFSGEIDAVIYDRDCIFTDPTLSFKGLNTFRRNIDNLKPLISRFVGESIVLLHNIKLDTKENNVKATWTMNGSINLPWRPRIDIRGETTYTFDNEKSGRVVDYYEKWELPAVDALAQLLKPGASLKFKPPKKAFSVLIDETEDVILKFYNNPSFLYSTEEFIKLKKALYSKKIYESLNKNVNYANELFNDPRIYTFTKIDFDIFGFYFLLKSKNDLSFALSKGWLREVNLTTQL